MPLFNVSMSLTSLRVEYETVNLVKVHFQLHILKVIS